MFLLYKIWFKELSKTKPIEMRDLVCEVKTQHEAAQRARHHGDGLYHTISKNGSVLHEIIIEDGSVMGIRTLSRE